ncbi:MAG: hypothetical protein ACI38Q_04435 [Candidatus Bruticola sp.]
MRFKHLLLAAACLATLTFGADMAQADNHFTTAADFKRQGVDIKNFQPICFSPDSSSILGVVYNGKGSIEKGKKYSLVVLDFSNKLTISRVRKYDIDIPMIEQVTYTLDGKGVVFTSRAGATFQKLDLDTGKITTIMEHKAGVPGFRCYPLLMVHYKDKFLATGFFYDKDDYAERNSLVYLDTNKTGVEAFTKIAETQKAQNKAHRESKNYYECMVSPNYMFFVDDLGSSVDYTTWKVGDDTLALKTFDKGLKTIGMWSYEDKLLYSVQRTRGNFDLVLYDAATNKKVDIASTQSPYRDLFLSQDGKTAMFSVFNKDSTRAKTYYARESEGWQVKPIEGYNEFAFGTQRLAPNGKYMFMVNEKGMRIFEVK